MYVSLPVPINNPIPVLIRLIYAVTMVAYMLKLMIAYVLLNYTVKLDGAIHPEGERFMQMDFVSPKTVMFRQRAF